MSDKKQKAPKASPGQAANARQSRMTDGLAQIVALMMRDRRFREVRIADLEWLVMPPI